MNEKTLLGARRRDKQRPALGRGRLPGAEAGTAQGDPRSGTRKRAEAEAGGTGSPRDQGAEKVAARSRGGAVTWSWRFALRRAGVLCACAAPGEAQGTGVGWLWGGRSRRRHALFSAAGCPRPAERLVHRPPSASGFTRPRAVAPRPPGTSGVTGLAGTAVVLCPYNGDLWST